MVVNGDGPIVANGALQVKVAAAARKPAQKKAAATVKPKPEVIEISPDTVERVKENKQKKKAANDSSMKKAATLTSTLTARSKVSILSSINHIMSCSIYRFFQFTMYELCESDFSSVCKGCLWSES